MRYGKENVILLNHDISPTIESKDIKRFKKEVADWCGLPITYANMDGWETMTPVDVCLKIKAWKVGTGDILCTSYLKTQPFYKWIEENDRNKENVYLYGYDDSDKEVTRMLKRVAKMDDMGLKTDYPLIKWGNDIKIKQTENLGILRPNNYDNFKHANCQGCLKAGWQHWYIVYVHRPDIWQQAREAEEQLGYSIHKEYLSEKEQMFEDMKNAGVPTTEHIKYQTFWAKVRKTLKNECHITAVDEIMANEPLACVSCMS